MTTQVESVQYKWLQNGIHWGIVQTEIGDQMVHQGNVGGRQHRGVLLVMVQDFD